MQQSDIRSDDHGLQYKVYPTLALCHGFVRWEACCRWIWVCSAVWKLPHVTYIMIIMVLVPLLSSPCVLAASLFGLLTPLLSAFQYSKLANWIRHDPPWYPCQDFTIKLNHIKPLPLLLQSSPPAWPWPSRGSTCHWTALWSSRNSPFGAQQIALGKSSVDLLILKTFRRTVNMMVISSKLKKAIPWNMQGLHKAHLHMIGGCTMFSMLYCYTVIHYI